MNARLIAGLVGVGGRTRRRAASGPSGQDERPARTGETRLGEMLLFGAPVRR